VLGGSPTVMRREVCTRSVFVIDPVALMLPTQGVADGGIGVTVGAGAVEVGTGVGPDGVQLGNLNDPIRVRHVRSPVTCMYSVVYQNVQSSDGSIVMAE